MRTRAHAHTHTHTHTTSFNITHLGTSSSFGATTLGGFWPALRFRSTIFYLYTSLSSFSLSSSLNPLLLGQAISVVVFLLVSHSDTFLTIIFVSILITCAALRNFCDFINFRISFLFFSFSFFSVCFSYLSQHVLISGNLKVFRSRACGITYNSLSQ